MAADPRLPFDPARDTAGMLRRVGVLVLMVALPLSAPALRIGPVAVYAIGISLLVFAAMLDWHGRFLRETGFALARSVPFVAAATVAVWAILSLLWTPAPAWRSAAGLGAVLVLGLAGIAALPERMRASNLYPIPLGAGALALVAIALGIGLWRGEDAGEVRRIERTLAILVLVAWPAIAWLRSRGRDVEAVVLAVAVAMAAALGGSIAPIAAFAFGAIAYLVAQLSRKGAALVGIVLGALLLLAPVFLAMAPSGIPVAAEWTEGAGPWRGALLDEPARLLTGHGFGSLRARPDLPQVGGNPLVALAGLWYELGVVGIVGMAVAIAAGLSEGGRRFGRLAPALAAAAATGFVLGLAGIGGGALWWPAALATVMLLFVATKRGQFRTRRPRALADFMGRGEAR